MEDRVVARKNQSNNALVSFILWALVAVALFAICFVKKLADTRFIYIIAAVICLAIALYKLPNAIRVCKLPKILIVLKDGTLYFHTRQGVQTAAPKQITHIDASYAHLRYQTMGYGNLTVYLNSGANFRVENVDKLSEVYALLNELKGEAEREGESPAQK